MQLRRLVFRRLLRCRYIIIFGLVCLTLLDISFHGMKWTGFRFFQKVYELHEETERNVKCQNENLVKKIKIKSGFSINQHDSENMTFYDVYSLFAENEKIVSQTRQVCRGRETELLGLSSQSWAYDRLEIDRDHGILYCPLLKSGSTFWRRVFYAVHAGRVVDTPYDVTIGQALGGNLDTLGKVFPSNSSSRQLFLNDALKIMFIREPYSRLLSGYVDKLFSPNPYFWNAIGKYITTNFRNNPSKHSKNCGHDVTFPEFIKYVIYSEEKNNTYRNAHFTPAYDTCKPCQINYNVIGKMDRFKEDASFIFNNLGYNISKSTLKTWATAAEEDAVTDSTLSPFGWWRWIVRCMPAEEAGKRIWKKMQIRGILDKRIKYPFKNKNIKNMSATTFIHAVLKARDASDRRNLKKQKLEALREAFSSLERDDVVKLQTLFRPDFHMFGYDEQRADIFINSSLHTWVFNLSTL